MSREVYNLQERPTDKLGREVIVNSFDVFDGLNIQQVSERYTVEAGIINIFDEKLTTEKRLDGGEFWIHPADVGKVGSDDFIEFSIVDKDDVLGKFDEYGLTVGEDILEITKYINNNYVMKGNKANGYYDDLNKYMKGTFVVIPGLYRRIYYHSINSTSNLRVISRLYYYI